MKNKLGFYAGKLALALSSKSTSAPGLLALKLAPNLLKELFSNLQSPIFITGTNGKSSSAGFLASILEKAQQNFIHNKSGANLPSGLLTALLKEKNLNNKRPLLEIDEAVLRKITSFAPAKLILITNFFRDQLDRFGEMEQTIGLVQEGLRFTENGLLINNADDPNTCHLQAQKTIYYGILPQAQFVNAAIFAPELASCPNCNFDLKYKMQWLGQLGDFYCPQCSYEKPKPQIFISELNMNPSSSEVVLHFATHQSMKIKIPLPGLFNIYNALGAAAAAYSLQMPLNAIKAGLETYKPLFGRSQQINYRGKSLKIFLIKNPIGASEILRLIHSDEKAKVLIAINDNYADGRDVSWLWDAHFEYLANNKSSVYVSGKRGSDMAIRLKYANVSQIKYYKNLNRAIDEFVENAKENENLYIIPTYTALLHLTHLMNLEKS